VAGLAEPDRPAPPGFLNLMAPSSAPSLLALFHARSAHGVSPFKALLLPRSRTLSPAPLPSWCCARSTLDPSAGFPSRAPKRRARATSPHVGPGIRSPHLQGFAPRESPPHRHGFLHLAERVALMGFLPSRVLPLAGMAAAFTAASPHEVIFTGAETTDRTLYRVSIPARWACLSRGCRPSWGCSPCDLPRKFEEAAVRELPPQAPGCVTVPSSSHL
jgi:hypothetical protein